MFNLVPIFVYHEVHTRLIHFRKKSDSYFVTFSIYYLETQRSYRYIETETKI